VRPANAEEQMVLEEVRTYQAMVTEKYPPGTQIPSNALSDFIPMLGGDLVSKLGTFSLAMNTMDHGVRR
jgi:hypothetical protein